MTAAWCRQVMEDAIEQCGHLDIVNTDQGSQFTSETFTELMNGHTIRISMDGKGRAIDNIFMSAYGRA